MTRIAAPLPNTLASRRSFALLLLFGLAQAAHAQTPTDALLARLKPQGVVSDFAGVLSASDRQAITERLATLRKKTGAQMAVVTVNSLEGGEIDDFTNKLFQRFGVGEKGKNNGVLLLVAVKDHKARIEVGYGLEPILPDALAGRILDEQLFPAFRRNRFGQGLRSGVEHVAQIIERGEPAPLPQHPAGRPGDPLAVQIVIALFFSLFVAAGALAVGLGIGTKAVSPIIWGVFFGGIPFAMGLRQGGRVAMVVLPIVGVLTFVLGILIGGATAQAIRTTRRGGKRWHRWDDVSTGPWIWGGSTGGWSSGGGGFSGGGFSSGGFSGGGFGGGSSGGGGASGSW